MNLFGYTRLLLLALYFSFLSTGLTAQTAAKDSVFYNQVLNQAAIGYQQMMADESRLINGAQYAGYPFSFIKGHQFFDSTVSYKGTIVYDHIFYQDIQLQYDEIADLVIVHNNFRKIELSSERISRFTIMGNKFARIEKNSNSSSSIGKTGFYQVLYEGKIHVYKKEVKEIFDELTSDQGVLHRILVNEYYFIKKDNSYLPVSKKKDLLNAYKDKRKEIREYISSKHLSYREDKEELILKVSEYYDQITK